MSLRCLFGFHRYDMIETGVECRPDRLQAVYVQRCERCGYMWPDLIYDHIRGDMGVHPHPQPKEQGK